MKKVILLTLAISFILSIVPVNAKNEYKEVNQYTELIKIKQPDQITEKDLTDRKDKYLLIEIEYGTVKDSAKNGIILNTKETKYNYISYKDVENAKQGNEILTVLVYNNNNLEDDILFRFDKIIKK